MESLLGDEVVLLAKLGYRAKRAISFDPSVGSRSNFFLIFRMLFSLGYLLNRYLVTWRSGRPRLRNGSKGQ